MYTKAQKEAVLAFADSLNLMEPPRRIGARCDQEFLVSSANMFLGVPVVPEQPTYVEEDVAPYDSEED